MAYCIYCGRKIDDNKQSCEYCQSYNQPTENNQQPYQQINQNEYNPNQGYPQYTQNNQGYDYNQNNGYYQNYPQGYPQPQNQYPYPPYYGTPVRKSKALSVIAMILSIFAFSLGLIMFLQLTSGSVYEYGRSVPASLLFLSCSIAGVVLRNCACRQGLVNPMNGLAKGLGIPAIVISALNIFIALAISSL